MMASQGQQDQQQTLQHRQRQMDEMAEQGPGGEVARDEHVQGQRQEKLDVPATNEDGGHDGDGLDDEKEQDQIKKPGVAIDFVTLGMFIIG